MGTSNSTAFALAIPIVGVAEVRTVLGEVASNARASQGRSIPSHGLLFYHADALQSVDEDPVAVQHGFQPQPPWADVCG